MNGNPHLTSVKSIGLRHVLKYCHIYLEYWNLLSYLEKLWTRTLFWCKIWILIKEKIVIIWIWNVAFGERRYSVICHLNNKHCECLIRFKQKTGTKNWSKRTCKKSDTLKIGNLFVFGCNYGAILFLPINTVNFTVLVDHLKMWNF